MRMPPFVFALLGAIAVMAAMGTTSLSAADDPSGLRVGAATSNITPHLGRVIIGNFGQPLSTYVHDELYARCIVLSDGKTELALVVCDLLGIPMNLCDAARAQIEKQTGIPADNILLCATHTHSASSALGSDRFSVHQELDEYQQFVVRRIADGVQRAKHVLRPAEFGFGTVDIPEHVFNRRWHLKPGKMPKNPFGNTNDQVKMNPSAGSPDLDRPAGPTDPQVSFLSFRERDGGKPIALLASYSLHYIGGVPGNVISSDYFGRFAEHYLELAGLDRMDPPMVPILANGTSGDINNINFVTPRPRKAPYEQMNYVARDVASKVLAKVNEIPYSSDVPLAAAFARLPIKTRIPEGELLSWAEKTLAAGPTRAVDISYIYAQRTIAMSNYSETLDVPLQVLRIGNLTIGTMPCEVFCEIGLDFKKRSPTQPAFLMSLSHGYLGYLPNPRQWDLGGYETWIGTNRLEREASDKMLEKLLEMAKSLEN